MVEVKPINDLHEHDGMDCACDPYVEWMDPELGLPYPEGPLVVHSSFDNREKIPNGRLWSVEPH